MGWNERLGEEHEGWTEKSQAHRVDSGKKVCLDRVERRAVGTWEILHSFE
jgi:hypothetical protein